jgi:hypothetical protein
MMRRLSVRTLAVLCGTLLLLASLGVFAWTQRVGWLAWYYARQVATAGDAELPAWIDRLEPLGDAALGPLVERLRQSEIPACVHVRAVLAGLAGRWPVPDPRTALLAEHLASTFPSLSSPGQQAALDLQGALSAADPSVLPALVRTLRSAGTTVDPEVHARALALAGRTLDQFSSEPPDMLAEACELLGRQCVHDPAIDNRMRLIRFAARPDVNLPELIVALLDDPVAEVRRSALLAVGTSSAVNTDDLLRWLHDPDEMMRHLCEKALRSRGLKSDHIQLGRLMTDSRAGARLSVLDVLAQSNDLEPAVWLRRLSHDPAPAVRAAAVRAAVEQGASACADRLEQMAQNDPCATVRQLAQYYLSCQRSPASGSDRRR